MEDNTVYEYSENEKIKYEEIVKRLSMSFIQCLEVITQFEANSDTKPNLFINAISSAIGHFTAQCTEFFFGGDSCEDPAKQEEYISSFIDSVTKTAIKVAELEKD